MTIIILTSNKLYHHGPEKGAGNKNQYQKCDILFTEIGYVADEFNFFSKESLFSWKNRICPTSNRAYK